MKRKFYAMLFFVTAGLNAQQAVKPDVLPQKEVTNTYHGITVTDPYQYLEDLNDPAVISWMKANTNYATAVLDKISGKQEMFNNMKSLIERRSASISALNITDDGTYFYIKRVPGEEIGKIYKRDGYKGTETLFFDPNLYKKEEGKTFTVSGIYPNIQGDKIAVSISANGSENPDLLIFKKSGEQYDEIIPLTETISWLPSGDQFFYTKLNSSDLKDVNRQIYMPSLIHKVGTNISEDRLYFSKQDFAELDVKASEIPIVMYSKEAKKVLLLPVSVDKSLKCYLKDDIDTQDWVSISGQDDQVKDFFLDATSIYYLTYKDAPNYKIVKASLDAPEFSNAKTVVPESKSENITNMQLTKDGLYYVSVKNGVEAHVYFLKHGAKEPFKLKLPFAAGQAEIASRGPEFSDLWVSISGWTSPTKRYLYNPTTDSMEYQPLSTPVEYPELKNLEVKEVMVKSHDGVMVPVSIVYNKNIKLNGENPAVIYSYGAYGISIEPFFSPITLAYTLYGGVLVFPHIRGGGELGDAWHKAGQKLNKPNTWKDGIATAEYIIDKGYTSPDKLSIFGGSAGGIFVGRAVTERPDLFVAASPMVGCMNPVRMEETPNGPVNAPEFGTVTKEDEFKGLLEMDSYLHLKEGTDYPAMLITAGMNDPRVIAWQPAKFAAKMQHDNSGDAPVLLYTNFEGGHGGRTTLTQSITDFSNLFSFFYWQSGHPDFQLKEAVKN